MFLGLWSTSSINYERVAPDIIEITGNASKNGLRIDYSNSVGDSKKLPGEFTVFRIGSKEPKKLDGNSSTWYNTQTILYDVRGLFTTEEIDKLGMKFDVWTLPNDGGTYSPVAAITFQEDSSIKIPPHIWPNDNIGGLAFILTPNKDGLFKGDIYPLLIPDSIDHFEDGDYTIHNGRRLLSDPQRLAEWERVHNT